MNPQMNGQTLRMRPSFTPDPEPQCAEMKRALNRWLEEHGHKIAGGSSNGARKWANRGSAK